MGREGVYAEDRTDVYTGGTGSSTQSTGSGSAGGMFFNQGLHLGEGIGGTPSPSFFPIKPSEKLVQQFRDSPFDGNLPSGKGNTSTLIHHKMTMRDRLATPPPLPPSPKKYRPHVHHLHHHSSQNGKFTIITRILRFGIHLNICLHYQNRNILFSTYLSW